MKKFYYILFLLLPVLAFVGCSDEGVFTPETDEEELVHITYRVKLGDESISRAIGDGKKVNELMVGVFQNNQLLKVFTYDKAENAESFTNVTIPLLKQETYDLVFWAQKKDNGIYTIDENNFDITIDYAKYKDISLVGTEDFEAFTVVKKGVSVTNSGDASITLTRPFAQLNIAASEEDIFNKVNKVSFTIDKVYKKFHPLTGVASEEVEGQGFSFSFSSQDMAAKQTITMDGTAYYYLASAYLLAPEEVSLTGGLYMDTELVKELNVMELPLKANSRTNIYGEMIQQEVLQGWDGVTFTTPTQEGVSCSVTANLHIDTPEELAWVMKYGYPANAKTIHICSNMNMGGKAIEDMKSVPEGVIIIGDAPQGTLPYSISNFVVSSTGLFGDAISISIKNIRFDNIAVSNAAAHTGVLVGTLKGSSDFENVTIENCSVNSSDINAVAGGMVGYISRIEEKSRDKNMSVSFDGCQVKSTTVEGSIVGKFVGLFSGYDNEETLTFTDCSTEGMADMDTSFENANKSCFSADLTEDDFLGNEKYHRGVVKFGDNRFVPKWDGITKVTPLKDSNTILIYSAFDVAYLQKSSQTAVTFKTDVDLGSKRFAPIKSITNLDGENNTIYNLKVDMVHDGIGAAFIQSTSGTTTHKNLYFVGADIHNNHNKSIPIPEYGNEEDDGAGNAYAGTLLATVGEGTYTVTNVHVGKGKVSAICKMGGLIGHVSGVMTMKSCSVKEYILENYEANIPNYYNVPPYNIADLGIVHGLQWWYTQGECGGLIGFIQSAKTIIKDCSVTDTHINCYGQPNKSVVANVWAKSKFDKTPLYSSGLSLLAKANTDIAGRHVNQFIGDIVSQRSEGGTNYIVTIEDYEVSGNRYFGEDASDTNDYNHNYENSKYCEIVGCAYYVGVDVDALGIKKHIMNCAGELTFNAKGGEKITITENVGNGNSIAWKGGSFTDLQTTILVWSPKSEYPAPPPTQ